MAARVSAPESVNGCGSSAGIALCHTRVQPTSLVIVFQINSYAASTKLYGDDITSSDQEI